MARISRIPLKNEILEKVFELFFEVVGKKSNIKEFKTTVFEILSPVERIMIAKRVAIVYLLLKGIDQRNIAKVLKVSTDTVSKFALLMEKSDGVVPSFQKILTNDKILDFLDKMFDALFPPGTYGTNWKTAWERRKRISYRKTYGL